MGTVNLKIDVGFDDCDEKTREAITDMCEKIQAAFAAACVEFGGELVVTKSPGDELEASEVSELSPFLRQVEIEMICARERFAPINSAHEGFAVMLEELDEFKAEVWKKQHERRPKRMLDELIQLAAMAARTAEDCGLMPREA